MAFGLKNLHIGFFFSSIFSIRNWKKIDPCYTFWLKGKILIIRSFFSFENIV
jgi:prenyltransferase beta subunit